MELNGIVGYLTQDDVNTLHVICAKKKKVVELGTCHGLSASILSSIAEEVYTVDIFEDFDKIIDEGSRAHYKKLFLDSPHNYLDVCYTLKDYKNIRVIKNLTYLSADEFENESIDLLFIDSDHSFSGVKRDVDAWEKKIKLKGLIAFHDSTADFWCVKDYLNTVFNHNTSFKKLLTGGSITAYERIV